MGNHHDCVDVQQLHRVPWYPSQRPVLCPAVTFVRGMGSGCRSRTSGDRVIDLNGREWIAKSLLLVGSLKGLRQKGTKISPK